MVGVASKYSTTEKSVDSAVMDIVNCHLDAVEGVAGSCRSHDIQESVPLVLPGSPVLAARCRVYPVYAVYLERSGYAADETRHRRMKTMVNDDGERKRFAHSGPAKQVYRLRGERAGVAFVPLVGVVRFVVFVRFPR